MTAGRMFRLLLTISCLASAAAFGLDSDSGSASRQAQEGYVCEANPEHDEFADICERYTNEGECRALVGTDSQGVYCLWVPPPARSPSGCQDRNGEPLICLPNIDTMVRGYNAMRGNPNAAGLDPGASQRDPGYAGFVFDTVYDTGTRTAGSAPPTGEPYYDLPDGTHADFAQACGIATTSSMTMDAAQYKDQLDNAVMVSGDGWGASFSADTTYQSIDEGSSFEARVYTTSEIRCQELQVLMDHPLSSTSPRLSLSFIEYVGNLSSTYKEEEYMGFIEEFGTHTISEADFGSRQGETRMWERTEFTEFMSQDFDLNVAASYSGFGIDTGVSSSTSTAAEQAEQYESESDAFGLYIIGTSNACATTNGQCGVAEFNAWRDSTYALGGDAVGLQLREIKDTIKEHRDLANVDPNIKDNLYRALDDYCNYLVRRGEIDSCEAPETLEQPRAAAVYSRYIPANQNTNLQNRDAIDYRFETVNGPSVSDSRVKSNPYTTGVGNERTPYFSVASSNPYGDLVPLVRCTQTQWYTSSQTLAYPNNVNVGFVVVGAVNSLDTRNGLSNAVNQNGLGVANTKTRDSGFCGNQINIQGGNRVFNMDQYLGFCSPIPKPGLEAVWFFERWGGSGGPYDSFLVLDRDRVDYQATQHNYNDNPYYNYVTRGIVCYVVPGVDPRGMFTYWNGEIVQKFPSGNLCGGHACAAGDCNYQCNDPSTPYSRYCNRYTYTADRNGGGTCTLHYR